MDFTNYSKKALHQVIRSNDDYKQLIATTEKWDYILEFLKIEGIKYTDEQVQYLKEQDWN